MFGIVDRLISPPQHLRDPDLLRFVYVQRPTLARFPRNLTYSDASVYVLVVLALGISGTLAALAPAWSATTVRPATALESE
jgi:ABC-type lipoprotein release transport system permease subunit